MKILLLECPKCHQRMKCEYRDGVLAKKRKACVYCGNSFAVIKGLILPSKDDKKNDQDTENNST